MKRWLAFSPLIVLALLAVLFAGYALKRDPRVSPHAMVGKPMPALTLPDLDSGQPQALKSLAGGPVLVNFFASWCAPCEIEHPQLMALKAQGVTVIGVAYKDAPANTQAFLTRLGDPFAARLVDRDGRAGLEFGVTGVPETFLIGADGMILAKHTGPLTPDAAENLLAKAR
ncbi:MULTISPECIES: DsbE family thiol:disulfide interchange protein [unclassified Caulobacter]|uniref:DsbE family thiol:disulfide interchange protein n=1 Tax=unclassified Caulobacter TaxID=2648921 RepID=UPI000D3D16BB|nr:MULTISPECIES: DsbE family thiol:disulfide interchange protein [unclassified Caulobacter]PTS82972.1 DsbE family thiol:disulfide interchange protein [Caulobacter sp. HMWF009]PTT11977.1 DsbE family thiol:disulfide interchange protein [Caulobacter sp. HMWF025]PTT75110.1 DsbE family thiol:disulfide interchange protein [Pseudomonas sp. HMWF010]